MAEVLRAVNILIPVSAVSELGRLPSFGERLASVLHATRSELSQLSMPSGL